MSWYYNQASGVVFQSSGVEAAALNAQILVMKHDPIPGQTYWGPYATEAAAQAAKAAHTPLPVTIDAVKSSIIPSTKTVLTAVEGWAVRFLEVAVGIVLLAVAAHAIISSGSAGESAATLAKAAASAVKIAK